MAFPLLWARIAALFANKADAKALNRATGVVLVCLGTVILLFHLSKRGVIRNKEVRTGCRFSRSIESKKTAKLVFNLLNRCYIRLNLLHHSNFASLYKERSASCRDRKSYPFVHLWLPLLWYVLWLSKHEGS